MLRVSDFDYELPEELIAQAPLEDRAASRMLVLDRRRQRWRDKLFRDLPDFLGPGDCLVLNDSRVFPARLYGHRQGFRGRVEVLLLRSVSEDGLTWQALVHPGRKMRGRERIVFAKDLEAEILGRGEYGERLLRFHCAGDLYARLDEVGHVPLPPYIRRPDVAADRERYQTVFARVRGSAAAPTAGLHFTTEMIEACRRAGAEIASLALHVGLGTFQPLHAEALQDVKLHAEYFEIDAANAARLAAAKRRIAVGTTSARTLETAARRSGLVECHGETDLFISPGFEFQAADAMLTNFHLPRSSLLILVCAFADKDLALAAYRHAVEERYRFYSYGDCMLIL